MNGCLAMATQAHRTNILEIELPSAFDDGNNMIRIPQAFAYLATKSPMLKKRNTICAACATQFANCGNRVDPAAGADATIAFENLFPQICRLRAHLPLVYAELRAEGVAAARHLKRTPATESTIIGTARNRLAINPASSHGSRLTHIPVLNCPVPIGSSVQQEAYKEKHVGQYRSPVRMVAARVSAILSLGVDGSRPCVGWRRLLWWCSTPSSPHPQATCRGRGPVGFSCRSCGDRGLFGHGMLLHLVRCLQVWGWTVENQWSFWPSAHGTSATPRL